MSRPVCRREGLPPKQHAPHEHQPKKRFSRTAIWKRPREVEEEDAFQAGASRRTRPQGIVETHQGRGDQSD